MEEIKPCPFCGGEAWMSNFAGSMDFYPTVECTTCGCNSGLCMTVDKAVERWNRRVE